MEGASVGASQIVFRPKHPIRGGAFLWDIGTAGSSTMLALALLPAVAFAKLPSTCRISGGLFQDFAPSALHFQLALLPVLRRMGMRATLKIARPGYVPKGGGIIELIVNPVEDTLSPLQLTEQGKVTRIEGTALSSHLERKNVSDRMADECHRTLGAAGYDADIRAVYDSSAPQPGAALAIFASTTTLCIIGADMAGAPRRTSEFIGRSTAECLIEDIASGATVDRFLADQLIAFAALGSGITRYKIPRLTEHVEANLWLVNSILGARTRVRGNLAVEIEGIGYRIPDSLPERC